MPTNNASLQAIIEKIQARQRGTDVAAVIANALGIWEQLVLKFSPLIGAGGVRIIYTRSLTLNQLAFPWLPAGLTSNVAELPFAALKISFAERQLADVIAANSALLATFINLLATLIGVRLVIVFLDSAFPHDNLPLNTQENLS